MIQGLTLEEIFNYGKRKKRNDNQTENRCTTISAFVSR